MAGEVRPRGIRLRLSCATEAEFIDAFLEYVDENSVFAPSERFLPRGVPVAFSIELADSTPMLRGLGSVLDCWSTADNRFERPGVHIELSQLTETSEVVLDRLIAARARANEKTQPRPGPRRRGAPLTQQQWGSDIAPATMQMGAQNTDDVEQTDVGPPPSQRAITRQRVSVAPPVTAPVPPAAPPKIAKLPPLPPGATAAGDDAAPVPIDEKTSQTTRYEGPLRAPAMPPPRGSAPALPPPPTVAAKPSAQPPPIPSRVEPIARPPVIATPPAVMTREQAAIVVTAAETSSPASAVSSMFGTDVETSSPAPRGSSMFGTEALHKDAPWWKNHRVGAVFGAGILFGVLISLLFRPSAPDAPRTTAALAQPEPVKAAECPVDRPAIALAATPPPEPTTPPDPMTKKQPGPAKKAVAANPTTSATPPATVAATKAPTVVATKRPTVAKSPATVATTSSSKVSTTSSSKVATPSSSKAATTSSSKVAAAKPTTASTAPTTAASAKPGASPSKTAVATIAAKPAPAKAPAKTAARKRNACSSLDCI